MRRIIIPIIAAALVLGIAVPLGVQASGGDYLQRIVEVREESRAVVTHVRTEVRTLTQQMQDRADEAQMQVRTSTERTQSRADDQSQTDSQDRPSQPPQATPDSPSTTASHYVALGDSVAAGAGLSSLTTASALDETCDRSSLAYPYQVAAHLQTTVTHLACSGAKVDEGIYDEQRRSGTDIQPQLDAAYEAGVPDVITATIGANDARWTQFIRQCYALSCGNRFDSARAQVYRADLRIELYRMLMQINQRSAGDPPQVLLSGYYVPFDDLDCIASNRVTASEQAWLRDQTAELNQAIASVVPSFSFAEYVPIDFSGHELCEGDQSWVQGIDAPAPFHPTREGQEAIGRAFIDAL